MAGLKILIGGTLVFWLAAIYPARIFSGNWAIAYSGVAALLCLVPTALTLVWGSRRLEQSPSQQLIMTLGGTVFRMGTVLAGGLLLYCLVPYFQQTAFWIWLLVFYLFTLTLEMTLLATERPPEIPS